MKTDVYEEKNQARAKDDYKPSYSNQQGDQAEMMKKMEAAGAPGPAHKALQGFVGQWKAEVKCWMDPAGSPEVTPGTAEAKLIFAGRFLEEEFRGQMMGKPFTGKTILGFDNTRQTFNSVWLSEMQTAMFVSEGKGDSGYKVITLEGKSTCPGTGQKDIPMKTVFAC